MNYSLVLRSGDEIYFYVLACAEVFQQCLGGTIKEIVR